MSTRANVVLRDSEGGECLWFYRHSDGYPEGALSSLETFINWVAQGKIRNNVEQAGGCNSSLIYVHVWTFVHYCSLVNTFDILPYSW